MPTSLECKSRKNIYRFWASKQFGLKLRSFACLKMDFFFSINPTVNNIPVWFHWTISFHCIDVKYVVVPIERPGWDVKVCENNKSVDNENESLNIFFKLFDPITFSIDLTDQCYRSSTFKSKSICWFRFPTTFQIIIEQKKRTKPTFYISIL